MKINLKKFIEELNFVKAASERMEAIPVLAFMMIRKVSDGMGEIIATDLDRTLRAVVEIEGIGDSFTLPTKKMTEIVGKLAEPEIELTVEANGWVKLQNGKAVFRMACENLANYPEIPVVIGEKLRINAGLLNSLIKNTVYAVTMEQSRFTLSGAKLLEAGGEWRMVSTDGHRLAAINTKNYEARAGNNDANVKFDVLIPRKALVDLQKMTGDCPAETEVIVGEDANHLSFSVGNRVLQCRKLSGNFPNYHMVIPKGARTTVTVNTQAMSDVLRRVALMADARTRSIVLTLDNDEITVSSLSSEEGEASESVKADGIDAPQKIEIGFNSAYLMDVFRLAEQEQQGVEAANRSLAVEYDPADANAQWTFIPGGLSERNLSTVNVVMPCRV